MGCSLGITTLTNLPSHFLREAVFKKLEELNKEAANRYTHSMRFVARNAADNSMEVVQLSEEALANLELKAGQNVEIFNGNNQSKS